MIVLKVISLVSPIAVLILAWKHRFSLLWLYAAAGLIIDNVNLLLRYYDINPHATGNLFVLIEFICISFYYKSRIFSSQRSFAVLISVLIIGFISHTIYTTIFELNFLGAGILCAVYITYGIAGYLRIINTVEVMDLTRLPFFWVNTAFFLYATSNCLLFLFATYLKQESYELMLSIWFSFFVSINILHYLLISIGLYKTPLREA